MDINQFKQLIANTLLLEEDYKVYVLENTELYGQEQRQKIAEIVIKAEEDFIALGEKLSAEEISEKREQLKAMIQKEEKFHQAEVDESEKLLEEGLNNIS